MELIVRTDGREERIQIHREAAGYRVLVGDQEYLVDSVRTGSDLRSLVIGGRQFEVAVRVLDRGEYSVASAHLARRVEVADPLTFLALQSKDGGKGGGQERISAYMPGRVTSILVAEGDEVKQGQGLLVLEAMKMENEIQAPHDATVLSVSVEEGQTVDTGALLFELG